MPKIKETAEAVFTHTVRVTSDDAKLMWFRPGAETLSADTALNVADSGKTYYLDSANEGALVTITLPTANEGAIGTHYKFAVNDASNGGFNIQPAGTDKFTGHVLLVADQFSSTTNGANGRMTGTVPSNNRLLLDADLANNSAVTGTIVEMICISAGAEANWWVNAVVATVDADSNCSTIFATA